MAAKNIGRWLLVLVMEGLVEGVASSVGENIGEQIGEFAKPKMMKLLRGYAFCLDCAKCKQPVFKRDEDDFEDDEKEICRACGTKNMIVTDSEGAGTVIEKPKWRPLTHRRKRSL